MSFENPKNIKDVIMDIDAKKYLLPSIQREFVWNTEQIEKLFDSLLKGYPIGTFLFWKIPNDKLSEFDFYEFLRDYHAKDKCHNTRADLKGVNDVIGVLDGQQRLNSLYIGLKGEYADKIPNKRYDSQDAYPVKKLYLNLLNESEDRSDFLYDFRFLTDNEIKNDKNKDKYFWFPVGEILNIHDNAGVNEYLIDKNIAGNKYASNTLSRLWEYINIRPTINYFLVTNSELDHVVNIFIRVNSGGTKLNSSDLLLSFITAQWNNRNVREEIIDCVTKLNEIGKGFNVNKDWFLKSCLALCDLDVKFKVDNFNAQNIKIIDEKWDSIFEALKNTLILIDSFGFNRENIKSYNSLIPIAYYLFKRGNSGNYIKNSKYQEDKNNINKWYVAVTLLQLFGGSSDTVLEIFRKILKEDSCEEFPYDKIIQNVRIKGRSLYFDDNAIEDLINDTSYKNNAFIVLSILYPNFDLRNDFHVDHIFPKSCFNKKYLSKLGIKDKEHQEKYLNKMHNIVNLQLLNNTQNKEKYDKDFKTWLETSFNNDEKRKEYMKTSYIPDINLDFINFEKFVLEREKLLKEAFKNYLPYKKEFF